MSSLSIILSADTSGFTKAIQDAKSLLEQYTQKNKELRDEIRKQSGVTDEQVNAYKRITKQLEKVGSGSLSTAQQQKVLENQIKELKMQWQNLSETAKSSDFGKAISESTRTAQEQLKQLREQMKAVSTDSEKSSEKIDTLSTKLGGNLVSSIMSLVGKFAVLATAQQVFDRLVNSNQAAADTFAGVMYTTKTAVNEFFYSITTGDFSVFQNGLSSLIARSRAAADAIDQLQNTIMSYNVIEAKAQSKIKAARAILYDPKATKEQKEQAIKDLEDAYKQIKTAAEFVVSDYAKKIKTEVEAKSNISLGDNAIDIIDEWLEIDAKEGRDKAKETAYAKYQAYKEELRKLRIETGQDVTSTDLYRGQYSGNYGNQRNDAAYAERLEKLNEEYKSAIVYKTLLDKLNDEELNALGRNRIAMIRYADATSDAAVQTSRLSQQLNNTNTGKVTQPDLKVKPLDLTVNPISWGKTEKDIKDHIAELNQKILNTPEGALRLQLIVERDEAEKQLKDFGKTPLQIELESKASNLDVSGVKNADISNLTTNPINVSSSDAIRELGKINDAARSLYSTFKSFEDFNEMNFGEQFFTISNAIFSTIDAISNFSNGVKNAIEVMQKLSAVSSALSQKKIAENTAETSSEELKSKAALKSAAANTFEAHSKIPWVGIAIAIGMIATMLATMSKFAGGGIVKGATTIGDMNIARLNDGEMVLNKGQQSHLFKMLNQGTINSDSTSNGEVHFKIQGKDLVGVLSNYNRKVGKVL